MLGNQGAPTSHKQVGANCVYSIVPTSTHSSPNTALFRLPLGTGSSAFDVRQFLFSSDLCSRWERFAPVVVVIWLSPSKFATMAGQVM